MNRLYLWWVLDCQPLRRFLRLTVSGQTLTKAYYARRPGQYETDAAAWAARQNAANRRPMLTCALRWDGPNAICWHCNAVMTEPHARRECTVAAPDIAEVIRREEVSYARMVDRGRTLLAGEDPATITGERLSYIHQTHGIDPSVVESIIGLIPEAAHMAYAEAYVKHKATGAAGLKLKTIIAS